MSVGVEGVGVAKLKTAASLTGQAICVWRLHKRIFSAYRVSGIFPIAVPEGIMPALAQSQSQSRIQIQIQVFQPQPN